MSMNPFIQALKPTASSLGLSEDAYYLQQLVQVSSGGSSSVIDALITAATNASDTAAATAFTQDKANATAISSGGGPQGLSGIFKPSVAVVTYDFSVQGGIIGDTSLGVTLPANAMVMNVVMDVKTPLDSATSAANVGVLLNAIDPLNFVVNILVPGGAFNQSLTKLVSVTDFNAVGSQNGYYLKDATPIRVPLLLGNAPTPLTLTVDTEALTQGKMYLFIEFFVSAAT